MGKEFRSLEKEKLPVLSDSGEVRNQTCQIFNLHKKLCINVRIRHPLFLYNGE